MKPYDTLATVIQERPILPSGRRALHAEPPPAPSRRRKVARRDRVRTRVRPVHRAVAQVQQVAAPVAPTEPSSAGADVELVDALRVGDAAAGDALVGKYARPLMRYLQRIAGADAAEELHQQTWLSVLANLDRFATISVRGSFKAWLFRIATNKAKDRWRSGTRERAAKEGVRRLGGPEVVSAEDRVGGVELGEQLAWALGQLPEPQRQAILLRYYSDLKFVDIAEVLGCPLNTALTRVHKGLIRLRSLMEQA